MKSIILHRIISRFLFISAFLVSVVPVVSGQKSFFKAIEKEDIKAVESYISKGIDPNSTFEKSFPKGSDNDKFVYPFVPLEYAVYTNHIKIVKLLIASQKSNPDYQINLNKAFGVSISVGNQELIRLLIDAGADINSVCEFCYGRAVIQIALEYSNFTLFHDLKNKGARIDVTDKTGRTLLHSVATTGNVSIAEELINANLDINSRDEDGATPVQFAAANGYLKLVKLFDLKGAVLSINENDGSGILINAVNGGNDTLVNYLLDKNFDVNSLSEDSWSPLLYACYNNNLPIVKTLIKKGADPNKANSDDEEPLLWAIWNKNIEMAKVLIDAGADLQIHDYRVYARKNIRDKGFLEYLDKKYTDAEG